MRVDGSVPCQDERLQQAILQTVVYADLFDYPLTPGEVIRYLGMPAQPATVIEQLKLGVADGALLQQNGLVALTGRGNLFDLRARREQIAARQWPAARRYARWLALTPFVRMVAVTGTLAVNNVEAADDIDVLVVTQPGRLWLCRALVILLVRLAALAGDELCPNYFLSEQRLELVERTLFGAREVTQMVPLYGPAVYWRIRGLNPWVDELLPQAAGPPNPAHQADPGSEAFVGLGWAGRRAKGLAEWALNGRVGSALERWEMERKVKRFQIMAQERGGSVDFSADCCKGHFDHHDDRILSSFQDRLARYGLDGDPEKWQDQAPDHG